jgi:hypothetical protein
MCWAAWTTAPAIWSALAPIARARGDRHQLEVPEFGSLVRGEAIAKMSEWRRKGIRRIDLKIIASDPDPAAVTRAVEALN